MTIQKDFIALQNKIDRIRKAKEKTLLSNYKKTLADLRKTMQKIHNQYEIEGQLKFEQLSKYGGTRLKDIDNSIAKAFQELYSENSKLTRVTLKNVYTAGYKGTMSIAEKGAKKTIKGILKPINVTKTINEDMAGLQWATRLRQGRNNVIVDVQRAVRQGLKEGMTYKESSKVLADSIGKDVEQPMRIIRTETKRVVENAKKDSLDHASKQGVRMVKTWITSSDGAVRGNKPTDKADHVSMHGVTVPYEEDFTLPDGTKTFAPGMSGVAKHDINERCTFIIDIVTE